MKTWKIVGLVVVVAVLGLLATAWQLFRARPVPVPEAREPFLSWEPDPPQFRAELWDEIARRYVVDGLFDYRGLVGNAEDHARFEEAIRRLAAIDAAQLPSDTDRFAFWMNAYNALTVYGVLRQLDVDDPAAVEAWRTNANLGQFWLSYQYQVGGRVLTLDALENALLRVEHPDARLHIAINCASLGCPSLPAEALDPTRLDAQLDALCRAFFADPEKFRVDREARRVYTSKILVDWFRQDFESWVEGGLDGFIRKYVDETTRTWLEANEYELVAMEYSWKLNIAP